MRKNIGSALLLGLMTIVVVAVVIQAAAPLGRNFYKNPAALSVTAQYTGTWTTSDSLVYVASDSAAVIVTVTGTATLDPTDRLYVGIGKNGAGNSGAPNVDTVIVKANPSAKGPLEIPFVFRTVIVNNGALTDTLYLAYACGGSSQGEAVAVRDVVFTADVADQ